MSDPGSARPSPSSALGTAIILAILAVMTPPATTPTLAQDHGQDGAQASEAPGPVEHLGHILDRWPETPQGRGLMAVAIEESQIASRHATLALRAAEAGDLEAAQSHAGHVIHALDPSRIADGPGLGFGFMEAARAIAIHIGYAAEHERATQDIRAHESTVSVSATNAADWAEEMLENAEEIRAATTAEEALPMARALWERSVNVVSGEDLNEDDEIRWEDGEGGIMHVQMQMSLLRRAEGRWYTPRTDQLEEEMEPENPGSSGAGHDGH